MANEDWSLVSATAASGGEVRSRQVKVAERLSPGAKEVICYFPAVNEWKVRRAAARTDRRRWKEWSGTLARIIFKTVCSFSLRCLGRG